MTENFDLSKHAFQIDRTIPLPVQKKDGQADEDFSLKDLTQEQILAGILTGIALFFQFREMGINGTMLFYNLENWLPFVVYLMTGSITGYISSVRRQETAFARKEHARLREKYLFLNEVYHGTIANKGEYKRQILS